MYPYVWWGSEKQITWVSVDAEIIREARAAMRPELSELNVGKMPCLGLDRPITSLPKHAFSPDDEDRYTTRETEGAQNVGAALEN